MKRILFVVCLVVALQAVSLAQKEVVNTKDAPVPTGPFSQAIKANGLVFCSGQLPLDPATGKLVEGDIKAQTQQVMKNLSTVLSASGSSLDKAVKVTIFLKSMSDYAAMNETYGMFFKSSPPARTTVQAEPPRNAMLEVEVIAVQ